MNSLIFSFKSSVVALPRALSLARPLAWLACVVLVQFSGHKADVYNILWALVFGFATLNILSLVARRFEPDRSRWSFGEMMAVMVVLVSITLLGWEFLNLMHIFPIRLHPR